MCRYLFLLDELPPTKSANGICAQKVMNRLKEFGEVYAITWDSEEKEVHKNYYVVRIPKKYFTRYSEKMKKKSGKINKLIFMLARILFFIKRMCLMPFWPVDSISCAKKYEKAAIQLIKEKGITHIIAVNYPGETLYAMKNIKKKYPHVKAIMYPLDVSLEGRPSSKGIEKKLSTWGGRRFFRNCAKVADGILVLENAKALFLKTFPQEFHKKFIYCGIPLLEDINWDELPSRESDGRLHIIFAGNLFSELRNPLIILDALEKSKGLADIQIVFDIYGQMDDSLKQHMFGRYKKITIVEHGWVDEKTLNEALNSADVLLNIGNSERHLIPSKVFKYMSSAKPILHLYSNPDDPCLPYLQKYENAFLFSTDNEYDKEKLLGFLLSKKSSKEKASKLFFSCTPLYTAEQIMKI